MFTCFLPKKYNFVYSILFSISELDDPWSIMELWIPEVRSPGSLHLPLGGAGAQCLRGADGVHRIATAGSYEAVGRAEGDDQQGAPGRDG